MRKYPFSRACGRVLAVCSSRTGFGSVLQQHPEQLAAPGRHNQAGDVGKEEVLLGHVVVAQHFAVVGGEDDPGVLVQAVFPQAGKQPAQRIIHLRDHCIVGAAGVCQLPGAVEMHVGVLVAPGQKALGRGVQVTGPVAVYRLGHGDAVVDLPEILAGIKGRMRLGEAGPEEEGPQGVPRFQKVDGAVHDPGGDAVPGVHGGECGHQLALHSAVGLGTQALLFAAPQIVDGERHALEAVAGAHGVEVHLAHGAGLVPGIGEQGGRWPAP